jgi:hypothetical protein
MTLEKKLGKIHPGYSSVTLKHLTIISVCFAALCLLLYLILHISSSVPLSETIGHSTNKDFAASELTIRVNTFRRNDQLELFLDYYAGYKNMHECAFIKEVQVIWSDPENTPPTTWLEEENKYVKDKVYFEVHTKNSLNNRFLPLTKESVKTHAVLSIDDDLIIPCNVLRDNLRVWESYDKALVGWSPRMHGYDTELHNMKYLKWQHTWWSGMYSIMLTKASFIHRDYLGDAFLKETPGLFLEHVDDLKNCEDLAMAHTVASLSEAPPVWISGDVYETGEQGISSGKNHFRTRGICLEQLRDMSGILPYVTSYQKMVPLSQFSLF